MRHALTGDVKLNLKKYFGLSLLVASQSQAHVRQRQFVHEEKAATSGQESFIHWDMSSSVNIYMHEYSGGVGVGTTENLGLTYSVTRALAGASLTKWTQPFLGATPNLNLGLESGLPYSLSSGCETLPGSTSQDGRNNILFTSKIDSTCATEIPAGSGIIGVTKVRYRPTTGVIVEADLQLDDISFYFKTSGSNDLTTTPKQINLNDVVVHELGHFLGLDHTSIRTSTMLFAVADEMQTPKNDDLLGIMSLYPAETGMSTAFGALKGSVMDASDNAIFGAVVFALDARSLQIVASEITNPDGAFEFCALPPGPYIIYANRYSPFGPNIHSYYSGNGSSRNGVYSSGGTEMCYNPACKLITETLTHTWWSEAITTTGAVGGLGMKVLTITAGQTNEFLNITGSTSLPTLVDVPTGSASTDASVIALDEPRLARLSASTLSIEDVAPPDAVGTDQYKFTLDTDSEIRISTASMGIFTRLQLTLELFAANDVGGVNLAAQTSCTGNTGNLAQGVVISATDPKLICDLVAGDYIVRITGNSVDCDLVPGNSASCISTGLGDSASTAVPYYLIAIVQNATVGDSAVPHERSVTLETKSLAAADYPGMPTCAGYSATVGTPSDSAGEKSAACCGTLRKISGGPSGPKVFLLSVLLNPAFLYGLYWLTRKSLGLARVRI